MRDAVGALVVCVRAPEYNSNANANPVSEAETDVASRADVRAVLDLMRDVGAVKGCIDEERDGYGDVVGVFVLVGGRGIVPVPVPRGSASGEGEPGLGDDDVDVGDGDDDTPLSVGWWEDQLFDLGLFGWEVVQWDPAEQRGEMTRNQFGGKNAPTPVVSFFFFFSFCLERG